MAGNKREWELVTITDKDIILDLAKFVFPHPYKVKEPKTPKKKCLKWLFQDKEV